MGIGFSTNQRYVQETSSDDECHYSERDPSDKMDYLNYTTDAIGDSPKVFLTRPSDDTITLDIIGNIGVEDLDFYEKVSLVYLLYDDAQVALQYLLQIQEGAHINVLLKWAQYAIKSTNWQGKLLETLCIIQNYQIVSKFGFSPMEATERFLPLNSNTSTFVNLTRKKLYLICDSLTNVQTTKFVEIIHRDMEAKGLPCRHFNVANLELYLLYWNTINFITGRNLVNLYRALKEMELYDFAEELEPYVIPRASAVHSENNSNIFNVTKGLSASEIQGESLQSASSVGDSAHSSMQQDRINDLKNCYDIDCNHPGIVMIINQEDFFTEFDPALTHLLPSSSRQLEKREGTNIDRNSLEDTFTKFGFKVIVKNNRTHAQMLEDVEEAVKEVKHHSSLIVCILSHGLKGCVYGVNSIPVEVSELQNIMCRRNINNLRGKPKILILQACQGTECQEVIEDENAEDIQMDGPGGAIPRTADMLVFWATVPGYGAVRDRKKGTWFIQALCKAIRENAHQKHFEDICTLVKQDVIHKRWETKRSTRAMVPIKESTLSRFFYLPSMRNC